MKRVFLIVLDSVGIGEMPDAAEYGDAGSHTLRACWNTGKLELPTLQSLGLYNIQGIGCGEPVSSPRGSFARAAESSKGKDTTIGHWEIAGVISPQPLPTYPEGFPEEVLEPFCRAVGRGVLCNRPYSGTQVIADFGKQHMDTGDLIVYTSADSVFQIAAHEEVVPIRKLYRICEEARKLLTGTHGVGRVIARPFAGEPGSFVRTANRHDFSLEPPRDTMLDCLGRAGLDTIGVGKIHDIFAGRSVSRTLRTKSNTDGMAQTSGVAREDFRGLCFVNLVDFDMLYGHRNNVAGYTEALNEFDRWLGEFLTELGPEDALIITADHGCDPATPSTDHSREYVPLVVYGVGIRAGADLGTLDTFADIGKTAAALLGLDADIQGRSHAPVLLEDNG